LYGAVFVKGKHLRMLRRLKREQAPRSPFVFTSERGVPFTTTGFRKMVARLVWGCFCQGEAILGVKFADGLEVVDKACQPPANNRRRLTDQAVIKNRR
jgi:hypothetical protein